MKRKLEPFSQNLDRLYDRPYEHLEPITDALIEAGNKPTEESVWYLSRDGWRSDFEYPLDFDLLERLFEFPRTINFLKHRDAIFCQNSWSEIRGSITDSKTS
jgi:hypothetical protein